eukprot:PhM_4_TR4300/c0_g1_i1/m.60272
MTMMYSEVDVLALRRDLSATRTLLAQRSDELKTCSTELSAVKAQLKATLDAAPSLWNAKEHAALVSEASQGHSRSVAALRHELVSTVERLTARHSNELKTVRAELEEWKTKALSNANAVCTSKVEIDALKAALDMAFRAQCANANATASMRLASAESELASTRRIIAQKDDAICSLKEELARRDEQLQHHMETARHTSALYGAQQRLVAQYEGCVEAVLGTAGRLQGAALHSALWDTWAAARDDDTSAPRVLSLATLGALVRTRGIEVSPGELVEKVRSLCPNVNTSAITWDEFCVVMRRWGDAAAPNQHAHLKEVVRSLTDALQSVHDHRTALVTCKQCDTHKAHVAKLEREVVALRDRVDAKERQRERDLTGALGISASGLVNVIEGVMVTPAPCTACAKPLTPEQCLRVVYGAVGVSNAAELYLASTAVLEREFGGNLSVLYPVLMNLTPKELQQVLGVLRPTSEVQVCDLVLRYVLYSGTAQGASGVGQACDLIEFVRFRWLPKYVLTSLQETVARWGTCPADCLCRGDTCVHQNMCLRARDAAATAQQRKQWLHSTEAAEESARGSFEAEFIVRVSYAYVCRAAVTLGERLSTNDVTCSDLGDLRAMQIKCDSGA